MRGSSGPAKRAPRRSIVPTVEAPFRAATALRPRRRSAVALIGVVLVAGAAYVVGHRGGSAPSLERVPGGPVVHVSAFAHHGRLAFVSHGRLWLLDGSKGKLLQLSGPSGTFVPQSPTFSVDGTWLAYLEASPNGSTPSQLWLARADGSDARAVRGIADPVLVGWSPRSDLLAVAAGPERRTQPCPCFSQTTIRLVSPDGSSRVLMHGPWVYGAAWSPDGTELAVAANNRGGTLATYSIDTGARTVWLSTGPHDRLNGMPEAIVEAAGWWNRQGIGFWAFGYGSIHNNDATPLDVVAAPGARPRPLGQTLSDGTTDAVAASPRGDVALVTDHGGGRAIWQDKRVDLCTPACRPVLRTPASKVSVDPVWSPDGRTLAFAEAPNVLVGPWSQRTVAAWYAAHTIWLDDTATGTLHKVPAAHGATSLTWSPDGKSLLYVRDDALWLLPNLTGKPVEIASPLFAQRSWPQYYAQIAWSAQFAWSAQ